MVLIAMWEHCVGVPLGCVVFFWHKKWSPIVSALFTEAPVVNRRNFYNSSFNERRRFPSRGEGHLPPTPSRLAQGLFRDLLPLCLPSGHLYHAPSSKWRRMPLSYEFESLVGCTIRNYSKHGHLLPATIFLTIILFLYSAFRHLNTACIQPNDGRNTN